MTSNGYDILKAGKVPMKKVVVLSIGKLAGDVIVAQIRRFFRETVDVERYCLHDELDFSPDEVIAVHQRDLHMTQIPGGPGRAEFDAMVRKVDKIDTSWRD